MITKEEKVQYWLNIADKDFVVACDFFGGRHSLRSAETIQLDTIEISNVPL